MDDIEAFSFGDGFRLEVGKDAPGRKVLKLFHKNRAVPDLLDPTLELLHYLVQHPHKELLKKDIHETLWPTSGNDIVEKHVHFLRGALKDDPDAPSYIKTLHGRGYKLIVDVKREGGAVEVYPKWDRARFYALMRDLQRGPEGDSEDLRIVATGIGSSLDELDLKGLLRKHIRMKILFINPANKALTDARYALRLDKLPSRCLRELGDQIADIQKYAQQYPPLGTDEKGERGVLEFGLSDVMPCGFVVHTREWALLGVYLAHDSYTGGPMIHMRSESEPWEALLDDWKERWGNFLKRRDGLRAG